VKKIDQGFDYYSLSKKVYRLLQISTDLWLSKGEFVQSTKKPIFAIFSLFYI